MVRSDLAGSWEGKEFRKSDQFVRLYTCSSFRVPEGKDETHPRQGRPVRQVYRRTRLLHTRHGGLLSGHPALQQETLCAISRVAVARIQRLRNFLWIRPRPYPTVHYVPRDRK